MAINRMGGHTEAMTTVLDLDRPVTVATRARPSWQERAALLLAARYPLTAVAVAVLLGFAAGYLAVPAPVAAVAVTAGREASYRVGGQGHIERVAFLGDWTGTGPFVTGHGPAAVVVVIRADKDGEMMCRITVGGVLKDERHASDGGLATCATVT
jgi:hypothetical protein